MDAFYVALYPYTYYPDDSLEPITFDTGDVFVLRDNSNEEWWLVSPVTSSNVEFYVPANYIEALTSAENNISILNNGEAGYSSSGAVIESSENTSINSSDQSSPSQPLQVNAANLDSGIDLSPSTVPLAADAACNSPNFQSSNNVNDRCSLSSFVNNDLFIDPTKTSATNTKPFQVDLSPKARPRTHLSRTNLPCQQNSSDSSQRSSLATKQFNMSLHHKAKSESNHLERSSFRKSLDDLITPDYETTPSMFSASTFSIATTAGALTESSYFLCEAPSLDDVNLIQGKDNYYRDNSSQDEDFLLRSGSVSQSSKTPYAFFESIEVNNESKATCSDKDILREGTLLKKVEVENSKSILSWASMKQQGKYFVQLTERALLFFKDKKHAQSFTNIAQSKPEHSVELFASNIEWKRGKKNTFQVWSDFLPGTKVLLKSPNPYDAAQWFDAISNAIVNLKTGVTIMEERDIDDTSLMNNATSTLNRPNKKNVTGATSNFLSGPDKISNRSSKLYQSQESTLNSTMGQSSTAGGVRNCLAQLLKSRPSVEALKKKGIFKSAPVFGCFLELRCESEKRAVPEFVINAMKEVEKRGLDIEGIYRLCGNMAEIQKLRFQVDKNCSYNLKQVNDIHVITGALKMYFRELPESLFPSSSYIPLTDAFSSSCSPFLSSREDAAANGQKLGADSEEQKLFNQVQSIITSFPAIHQTIIYYLFSHLHLVVENHFLNKMDTTNLAIVFGPNLLFAPEYISMASSVSTINTIITYTLANVYEIFSPDVLSKLPSFGADINTCANYTTTTKINSMSNLEDETHHNRFRANNSLHLDLNSGGDFHPSKETTSTTTPVSTRSHQYNNGATPTDETPTIFKSTAFF